MKFIAIIPARYASTRFRAKPLAVLGGKPVIRRVYEQVAGVLDDAVVATDDERIYDAVVAFGGKAEMTSADHKQTARIAAGKPTSGRESPTTWSSTCRATSLSSGRRSSKP